LTEDVIGDEITINAYIILEDHPYYDLLDATSTFTVVFTYAFPDEDSTTLTFADIVLEVSPQTCSPAFSDYSPK